MLPFWQKQRLRSCNMQVLNAPRCTLVPTEFKFHLYWILAVRLHCSGSRILTNTSCQKLNWQQVRKPITHSLFNLTVANHGQMPIKMYTKLNLIFLGLKVPKMGILIVEELNQVLDKKCHTRLPGIVGWNLIWLSYDVFVQKCGTTGFNSFKCSQGVNPLLFSQLCIFIMPTCKRIIHWEQHQRLCPEI